MNSSHTVLQGICTLVHQFHVVYFEKALEAFGRREMLNYTLQISCCLLCCGHVQASRIPALNAWCLDSGLPVINGKDHFPLNLLCQHFIINNKLFHVLVLTADLSHLLPWHPFSFFSPSSLLLEEPWRMLCTCLDTDFDSKPLDLSAASLWLNVWLLAV